MAKMSKGAEVGSLSVTVAPSAEDIARLVKKARKMRRHLEKAGELAEELSRERVSIELA